MSSEPPEEGAPPGLPDFDVWNYLDSAWQEAYDDLARTAGADKTQLACDLARLAYGARRRLIVPESSEWLRDAAQQVLGGLSEVTAVKVTTVILKALGERRLPLVSYAMDLEVASEGIGRANQALDRARLLDPLLGVTVLPDRARKYLEEAVGTFLFGFDAACIAFCCSAFEQLGKHRLVEAGVWTEGYIRKNQPTGFSILAELARHSPPLVSASRDNAEALVRRRNQTLHSHVYDEKILKQSAIDSISDLLAVARELCT